MHEKKARRGIDLGVLYQIFSLAALSYVVVPFAFLLLGRELPHPLLLSLVACPALVFAGYSLQALFSFVTHTRRIAGDHAYESNQRYFQPGRAVLSLTLCALCALALFYAARAYLAWRFAVGQTPYFDENALWPYLVAALASLCLGGGVVAWFYPYHRLLSLKTFFPCLAFFFIAAVLSLQIGQGAITVSLLLFLIFSALSLNQGSAQRLFDGTRTVRITASGRLYNLALALLAILAALALAVIALAIVVGVSVLVRLALYLTIDGLLPTPDNPVQSGSQVASSLSHAVFDGLIDVGDASGGVSRGFFGVFLLLVALLLLAPFLGGKAARNAWRSLKRYLSELYENILLFLRNALYFNRIEREAPPLDYHDEERKLDPSVIRAFTPANALQKKGGYRRFLRGLEQCPTLPARVEYAYATLVALWRTQPYGLRPSDTPREIRDKVLSHSSDRTASTLTAVFEAVHYTDFPADEAACTHALQEMCNLVRLYSAED